MENCQKFLVPSLRKELLQGFRKRKLSKRSKDIVVDPRGSKWRKISLDVNELVNKTHNKRAAKKEKEESVGLNDRSILPLSKNKKDSCLLFLKQNQTVAVKGKVQLHMLQGAVDVMGYRMQTGQKSCLFSPSFSSLLTIKDCSNTEKTTTTTKTLTKDVMNSQSLQIKEIAMIRAQYVSSVLIMTKIDTVETNFVCQFREYEGCFSDLKDGNSDVISNEEEKYIYDVTSPLGFTLVEIPSKNFPVYKEPEELVKIMNDITKPSNISSTKNGSRSRCILVCGGKGTGKSSFARYVVNNLLNSCSEVCYLECDVGQTEFTPPAVLSLNHITKPLLGPPFTHLKWPERAHFFGDVSSKDNPNLFINSINSLYQFYRAKYLDKDVPLVVNTQGWVKGLGVPLLLDVIRIVRPSHIIQINSPTKISSNLQNITRDFLDTSPGWLYPISVEEEDQNKKMLLNDLVDNLKSDDKGKNLCAPGRLSRQDTRQSYQQPTVFHVTSCAEGTQEEPPQYNASDYRTMNLLAYFSQTQEAGTSNVRNMPKPTISLMECQPYKVSWNHVAVHVVHTEVPRSQILVSLNASIVGLAISPNTVITDLREDAGDLPKFLKNMPIVECVGLGIVRNIDPINKLFYILTPVPLDQLHRVNTLLKGKLEIPATLLIKEKRPSAPYVSSEFSSIMGANARKMRKNLLRRNLTAPKKP